MPTFHGGDEQKSSKGSLIKIENIMNGLEDDYLSAIDLKLGTSSITMRCKQGQQSESESTKEMRDLKDQKTTTARYGFVVSGYQVRDSQSGKLIERYYKYPYKNR